MSKLVDFYKAYPARINGLIAGAVVFVALKVGVVLPELSVLHTIEAIAPILLAAEATHRHVTPAK